MIGNLFLKAIVQLCSRLVIQSANKANGALLLFDLHIGPHQFSK